MTFPFGKYLGQPIPAATLAYSLWLVGRFNLRQQFPEFWNELARHVAYQLLDAADGLDLL